MDRRWWHGLAIWAVATVVDAVLFGVGFVSLAGFLIGVFWMQTGGPIWTARSGDGAEH